MTWLSRRREQRRAASMTDPVAGTLQVTAASSPPSGQNAVYSTYRLTGVISAPGVPPSAVEHRGIARLSRWPQAGSVLPVTVDRAQPTRFVITWDQVPSSAEQALADARDLALREQINLDFGVVSDAIADGATPPPGWTPPPTMAAGQPARPQAGVPQAEAPPGGATGSGPSAGPPVPGTVVAVYPVQAPAAFTPAGGLWDLSVQTAGRTVLVRASCTTDEERARIARVGAAVRVSLSGSGDVATLVS